MTQSQCDGHPGSCDKGNRFDPVEAKIPCKKLADNGMNFNRSDISTMQLQLKTHQPKAKQNSSIPCPVMPRSNSRFARAIDEGHTIPNRGTALSLIPPFEVSNESLLTFHEIAFHSYARQS